MHTIGDSQRRTKTSGWLLRLTVMVAVCGVVLIPRQAQASGDALLQRLAKPPENRPVYDLAKLISPADREQIEQRCLALREKNGAALVVVILPSLEGGQIDDFTNKLFAQWKPGDKERKDGVMLLVAVQDRKARIEVGYGLEPVLPDALAGRILNEQLFPAFKQQRYADGLKAAVNRIAEIVERGEPAPANLRRGVQSDVPLWVLVPFLALFVAIGSFLGGAGIGARVVFLMLFGAFFGGIPFFMGCVAGAPVAPLVHTPLGLALGWLGWKIGRKYPSGFRGGSGLGGGWSSTDTWVFGGSNWGSSSGSSWSSGGFSSDWGGFGGGSSGGGGASGGW